MLLCFLFFFSWINNVQQIDNFLIANNNQRTIHRSTAFFNKHTLTKIKKTRLTFNDNGADSTISKKMHNRCEDARKIDIQTKYWKKHRCWKLNEIFNHNFTSIPSRSIIFTFAFTHIHTKVVTSPFVTLFHDKKDV